MHQAMYSEMTRMQQENENLLLHLRQLTGEDLSALSLDDLGHLESQLEMSVHNVKNRKVYIHTLSYFFHNILESFLIINLIIHH